jgi:hypothetical protein
MIALKKAIKMLQQRRSLGLTIVLSVAIGSAVLGLMLLFSGLLGAGSGFFIPGAMFLLVAMLGLYFFWNFRQGKVNPALNYMLASIAMFVLAIGLVLNNLQNPNKGGVILYFLVIFLAACFFFYLSFKNKSQ